MLVFNQCSKVNLLVCKDISPEDWGEVGSTLLGFKVLECSFNVGEIGVLEKVGFPCSGEGSLMEVLPWWTTTRFVPIPGIVTSVIPLVITGTFEESTLLLVPRFEGELITWVRLGKVLNGSLSLAISIWLPSPILSKTVSSGRGVIMFTVTLGDHSHSGAISLLNVLPVHDVSFGALFC